jgi:hypothetical protein
LGGGVLLLCLLWEWSWLWERKERKRKRRDSLFFFSMLALSLLLATNVTELCPAYSPFFGSMGVTSSIVFTGSRAAGSFDFNIFLFSRISPLRALFRTFFKKIFLACT